MASRKSPFFNTATTLGKIVAFFGVSALCGVLAAGMLVPAASVAGSTAAIGMDFFDALPAELKQEPLSQPSKVVAKDGTTLATFYAENRTPVELDEISKDMQNAIVSIEDERFYEHNGVDLRGIARAAAHNFTSSSQQGASTLTQQYVNNVLINAKFLSGADKSDITYSGTKDLADKLREAKLAISVEKEFTKKEILQGYLNLVLFSGTNYGVEAAAERYFSVHAKDLNIQQSAMLAGMVQRPNTFDPIKNPDLTLKRRNTVLGAMLKTDSITKKEYDKAVKTKLGLKPKDVKSGCVAAKSANYFCDYVSHEIMKDPAFGKTKKERETLLYRGGLTIKTTLDPRLQKEAEKETTKTIPADDSSNMGSAIVTVEPGTGNILAMAQNKKYGSDPDDSSYTTYNLTAGRSMGGTNGFQGGSTMKPYTAIAWLEDGRHMWDKVNAQRRLYDANFHWKASCMPKGYVTVDGGYEPKNFDAGFRKPMTADYGLYWSINTATGNEASQLDLCKIADVTERVGLLNAATGKPITGANPSFVIGADPITPLAQATAFATFANKGEYCKNRALTSVTDAAGNSYKGPGESCEQVIDEQVIANLNGTLKRIAGTRVAKGTIDKPIAGKTGTNNTASSTWFVGYSTGMATAAWTGRFDGNAQIKGVEINGKRYSNPDSSTLAAPLWLEYTKDVIDYYPAKGFGSKDSKPGKSPDHSDSPDNGPAGDAGDDNNDDD
ncbi:MAG: transglycosylase domain-containing protein [Micrococcaceae bacterium]|nr:transglycosylase domain-containing protein [Micrococcaceae bacterium]